jgi:hypothetical protein
MILIDEQDKKIVELATKLAYANRSIEIFNEEEKEEPQYLYVYNHVDTNTIRISPTLIRETSAWIFMGQVRVEK